MHGWTRYSSLGLSQFMQPGLAFFPGSFLEFLVVVISFGSLSLIDGYRLTHDIFDEFGYSCFLGVSLNQAGRKLLPCSSILGFESKLFVDDGVPKTNSTGESFLLKAEGYIAHEESTAALVGMPDPVHFQLIKLFSFTT